MFLSRFKLKFHQMIAFDVFSSRIVALFLIMTYHLEVSPDPLIKSDTFDNFIESDHIELLCITWLKFWRANELSPLTLLLKCVLYLPQQSWFFLWLTDYALFRKGEKVRIAAKQCCVLFLNLVLLHLCWQSFGHFSVLCNAHKSRGSPIKSVDQVWLAWVRIWLISLLEIGFAQDVNRGTLMWV